MRPSTDAYPLFERLPKLRDHLPYMQLIKEYTPITKLETLGDNLGIQNLYVKDDGLTGPLFGGNKVRKLEFLLAEAKARGAKRVITFGAAGSNCALASAAYATSVGLKSSVILTHQPWTESCQKNLLYHTLIGTDIHVVSDEDAAQVKKDELVKFFQEKEGASPYVVPMGGSNEIGTYGYINAAFELANQVEAGIMPEPDYIYIACCTTGTTAGLALGLKLLGWKTKLISVKVNESKEWTEDVYFGFLESIGKFLKEKAGVTAFEECEETPRLKNFYCAGYAAETPQLREAIDLAKTTEDLDLEIVYTAKSLGVLIEDARKGVLKDKTVLFWKTNNSVDISKYVKQGEKEKLPESLRKYVKDTSKSVTA